VIEDIKDWLDAGDVVFYEAFVSLRWPTIFKLSRYGDPQGFWESGGWDFLLPRSGSDASTGSDGDDNYEMSQPDASGDGE